MTTESHDQLGASVRSRARWRVSIFFDHPNAISIDWRSIQGDDSVDLRWYLHLDDGFRPVHDQDLLTAALEHETLSSCRERFDHDLDQLIGSLETDLVIALHAERRVGQTELDELLRQLESNQPVQISWGSVRVATTKPVTSQVTPSIPIESQPLVSVIIPTFGRAELLATAIQSVIDQTYTNWELFVVDDNAPGSESRASTTRLMQSLVADSRIRYLTHPRSRNGAAARNTGLLASRGDYVTFLDDDDMYLPRKIEASLEAITQYAAPYEAVYGGYVGWDSEHVDPNRFRTGDLTLDLLSLQFQNNYLTTTTTFYRRHALMAINGFDETYRRHQDLELNLRYFERFLMGAVPEVVVRWRPANDAASGQVGGGLNGPALFAIKQKFLKRFQSTIERFPSETQKQIYEAHWRDAKHRFGGAQPFLDHCASLDPQAASVGLSYELMNTVQELRDEIAALKADVRREKFRDELWWASLSTRALTSSTVDLSLELATHQLNHQEWNKLLAARCESSSRFAELASELGALPSFLHQLSIKIDAGDLAGARQWHASMSGALRDSVDTAIYCVLETADSIRPIAEMSVEQAIEMLRVIDLLQGPIVDQNWLSRVQLELSQSERRVLQVTLSLASTIEPLFAQADQAPASSQRQWGAKGLLLELKGSSSESIAVTNPAGRLGRLTELVLEKPQTLGDRPESQQQLQLQLASVEKESNHLSWHALRCDAQSEIERGELRYVIPGNLEVGDRFLLRVVSNTAFEQPVKLALKSIVVQATRLSPFSAAPQSQSSSDTFALSAIDGSFSSQGTQRRPSQDRSRRFPKSIDRWIDPQIRRRCLTRFVLIPDHGPAVFLSLPGYRFGRWSFPAWPGSSHPHWTKVCDAPGPRISLPASHEMVATSVRNPAIRLGRLSGFVVRVLGKAATSIEAYASVDRERLPSELQTVLEPARDPCAILLSEPISDAHSELWLGFRSTTTIPGSRIQICGLLLQL